MLGPAKENQPAILEIEGRISSLPFHIERLSSALVGCIATYVFPVSRVIPSPNLLER